MSYHYFTIYGNILNSTLETRNTEYFVIVALQLLNSMITILYHQQRAVEVLMSIFYQLQKEN